MIPTSGNPVEQEEPCDDGDYDITNGDIAFHSNKERDIDIYVMEFDGTAQVKLSSATGAKAEPSWSPNGKKIAYVGDIHDDPNIYIINADGTDPTRITNSPESDSSPAWSPDGTKIVFDSTREGCCNIFIMNADGTDITKLTNFSGTANHPHWSPDGTKIVFEGSTSGAGTDIFVINTDGTGLTRLTSTPPHDFNGEAHWSPDGTEIVFRSNRILVSNDEIFVMNADGTDQRNITNHPSRDTNPTWSPDGTKIAFVSNRDDGKGDIFVMNRDGTGQTNITNNDFFDGGPEWQPIVLEQNILESDVRKEVEDSSGSSANKHLQRPTFGLSHDNTNQQLIQNGFTVNGKSFDITDNWHTDFERQTIMVGEKNTLSAKSYAPYGLQSIEFMFGIPEVGQAHKAEAAVEVWLTRTLEVEEVKVVQKDNLINEGSVAASAKMVSCTNSDTNNNCYSIEISASFNEAPIHDVFALKGMDFTRRVHTTYLNDGFEITGESLNPPKTETAALPGGGQSGITQLMTQTDKKNDLWVDESGYYWTKNSYDTWIQTTPPDFQRHQDDVNNVMTRLNSNFDLIKQYESKRATKSFDSGLIQNEISESFSYEYPERMGNILDDPQIQEKMKQENNLAESKLTQMWNSQYPITRQNINNF